MPFVKCTIPNASNNINGHQFVAQEDGSLVSKEPIPPKDAAIFLSIPGYEAVEVTPSPVLTSNAQAAGATEAPTEEAGEPDAEAPPEVAEEKAPEAAPVSTGKAKKSAAS